MRWGDSGPSHADLAAIRAIRAWGDGDCDGLASRLSPEWRERLRRHWSLVENESPDVARSELLRSHEASTRPDVSRVHTSWFIRALQGESKAVRRAVASRVSPPLGETLRLAPRIMPGEGGTPGEADPEAVALAMTLWVERLVGDTPNLQADAPVVVALASLRPRDLFRLIKTCGVIKLAFAVARNAPDESLARFGMLDRVRFGFFRRHVRVPDARLAELAGLDIEVLNGHRRHGLARLGLVTIGRLLAEVETYRARWALQHLPYPIAKMARTLGVMPIGRKSPIAWEGWILDAAWWRLHSEGRQVGLNEAGQGPVVGAHY